VNRVDQFLTDGARLSDADAARLLIAVQETSTRDALWGQMTRDTSRDHQALWVDMTRRAPDQVRAPAAALAGVSSWLAGDGAKAWCALDQVPRATTYSMAAIVAGTLEAALPPSEWEEHHSMLAALASELDESFVPRAVARSEHRGPPPDASRRGRANPQR
jgi:hypothetical protein